MGGQRLGNREKREKASEMKRRVAPRAEKECVESTEEGAGSGLQKARGTQVNAGVPVALIGLGRENQCPVSSCCCGQLPPGD